MSRKNGGERYIKSFDDYVGRHPKIGKKKGGIKIHLVIHANEGVPCDVKFTSVATNATFMLAPSYYNRDEIAAYINYEKIEELTD